MAAAGLLACLLGWGSPLRAQSGDVLTVLPAASRRAAVRSTVPHSPVTQGTALSSTSRLLLPGWAVAAPEAHGAWQGRLEQAIDDRVAVFGGYARRGSRGFLGLRLRF
ncbi:MAG TPA: hypothetical protein VFU03_08665 [Gemmatimonadales bacterium]|nr:hypothetical protein [Gemmatimonadales bacterium]